MQTAMPIRIALSYRGYCSNAAWKCSCNITNCLQFKLHGSRSYSNRAYFHRQGQEPLQYVNLGQLVERAVEQYGSRPAIISCHENKTLTFEAAKEQAEKLAVKLQSLGLQRGEHLGIWLPNTVQWYITFLASTLGGFPLVCLNHALQAPEVEYALKKAKVRTLITMDECGKQNFCEILKVLIPNANKHAELIETENLPLLKRVLVKSSNKEESPCGFLSYDHFVESPTLAEDIAHLNVRISETSPDDIFNVQFTSGTTGQPKAALLSHFNFVNNGYYFGRALDLHESHKRICLNVPLFHAFGLAIAVSALNHGATLVLPAPTFNGSAALEAIDHEHCNVAVGTPTMFIDMIENQQRMQKSVQSLELGLVGGAACTPTVYRQSKAVLGLKKMKIGYGQTEASAAFCAQDGTEPEHEALHTVGKQFEHCEAKVINDKGDTVAFGETGELCVRGCYVMRGYLDDEVKTKEALLPDGWLKTGDEFIMESNGTMRIVGRKKEMIIRGGENIFPKEIEAFLEMDERVLEAQVVGVPDERLGEEICAYLRVKPDVATFTEKDVRQICKGKLAHFKVPRYVRIVKDYPKTSSGKIQKFKLQQMFENE